MMKQLAKMLALVATKFENKIDRGGRPYFLHCMRVMLQMPQDDEELMCIALGHDLLEDTEITTRRLYEMGFSERIIIRINMLTHSAEQDYDSYIRALSHYPDVVKVKLADLKDNSDITRLKGLTKKDFERMEKYHRAYTYLSKI